MPLLWDHLSESCTLALFTSAIKLYTASIYLSASTISFFSAWGQEPGAADTRIPHQHHSGPQEGSGQDDLVWRVSSVSILMKRYQDSQTVTKKLFNNFHSQTHLWQCYQVSYKQKKRIQMITIPNIFSAYVCQALTQRHVHALIYLTFMITQRFRYWAHFHFPGQDSKEPRRWYHR